MFVSEEDFQLVVKGNKLKVLIALPPTPFLIQYALFLVTITAFFSFFPKLLFNLNEGDC